MDFMNQIDGFIVVLTAIIVGLGTLFNKLGEYYKITKNGIEKRKTMKREEMSKTMDRIEQLTKESREGDKALSEIIIQNTLDINAIRNDIAETKTSIEELKNSDMDLLRAEFLRIFYKYRQYSMILTRDAECLTHIYDDYIALGGNSFVFEIYNNEVLNWKTVESWDEIWKAFPNDIRNPYNRQD